MRLDQYLAVAYFQQGVSNFLLGDFEEALANFNDTLLYLRGNTMIDYAQLGLLFKLYSCEVLFNRGLCYIYLQQKDPGMQDLQFAVREKVVEDHNVIDEAIQDEAEGYTVFSIPVGVVYRPNEAKVRNLKTKDYLGKAKLVAASDRSNAFTGFAGSEIKNVGYTELMCIFDQKLTPSSLSGQKSRTTGRPTISHSPPPTSSSPASPPGGRPQSLPSTAASSPLLRHPRTIACPRVPPLSAAAVSVDRSPSLPSSTSRPMSLSAGTRRRSRRLMHGPDLVDLPPTPPRGTCHSVIRDQRCSVGRPWL